TTELLDLGTTRRGQPLAVFSGSVSGQTPAHMFQNTFESQVAFHSFVQNDDEILERFCSYMQNQQPGFDPGRIAIISEDETAYGGSGMKLGRSELDEHDKAPKNDKSDCARQALRLYFLEPSYAYTCRRSRNTLD